MGPIRTSTSKFQHANAQSEVHKPPRKQGSNTKRDADARVASASDIPGVQKLKSALRQTRRLLARDNLAADVRVETERRLRSLQSDLETAERRRKERTMAKRYHKVKFFERRKVLRKIKRVKMELEKGGTSSSKDATTKLENTLFELRAQLNYILNYPKLEKYISLFPPSKEEAERNPDLDETSHLPQNETDARRDSLLRTVTERMVNGELSGEPESEVKSSATASASAHHAEGLESIDLRKPGKGGALMTMTTTLKTKKSSNQKTTLRGRTDRMADDDFFDRDTGSKSGSESTLGSGSNTSDSES